MSEIQTTPAEAETIRLLADNDMYSRAVDLAGKQLDISDSQLAGLRQFSRSWDDLNRFVRHQKERHQRDKSHYQDFYNVLHTDLQDLRTSARKEFVPDDLSKKEARSRTDHFAGQLAQAFIQHLTAEIEWQTKGQP